MIHLLEAGADEVESLARQPRVVVALDFDGTLAPLAPTPETAWIDPAVAAAIERLRAGVNRSLRVGVVSGRRIADLRLRVPSVDFLIGLHGLEIELPPQACRLRFDSAASDAALDRLRAKLPQLRIGEARVEDKIHSITLHVRGLAPEAAAVSISAFEAAVAEEKACGAPLEPLYGHLCLEARPTAAGKHHAIAEARERLGSGALAYLGDDTTDEEVFRAFPGELTVLVTESLRRSAARYYLRSPRETAAFLERLAQLRVP